MNRNKKSQPQQAARYFLSLKLGKDSRTNVRDITPSLSDKKRGLSPAIATMLLVSIAVALAVIVFFWARSFIGESITKGKRDISLSCDEVDFRAEAYDDNLYIENLGDVPLHGVEIRKKQIIGEIVQVETTTGSILAGQTEDFELDSEITNNDELVIIPVLLGETSSNRKAYICDESYGREIVVG